MASSTYIIAWDISDSRRLASVGRAVKGWKVTGQKSVAECWLTPAQRDRLLSDVHGLIAPNCDRLLALRLDPRCDVYLFGIAYRPVETHFVIA
jgi:CRISPR-associated protein Cas2